METNRIPIRAQNLGTLTIVYAFAPAWRTTNNFEQYDWSRLTDVCLFGDDVLAPATIKDHIAKDRIRHIVAIAHAHGVKVHGSAFHDGHDLDEERARQSWVDNICTAVTGLGLDGINIDIEFPITANDTAGQRHLTDLVGRARQALNKLGGAKQLSFDAAWSPAGIDGRHYDLHAIAQHVDFLFVMAYDVQSQMWTAKCTAQANSPLPQVRKGLRQYLQIVPASKLVLGLPWYGYDYACSLEQCDITSNAQRSLLQPVLPPVVTCHITKIPFHGAPCSDAAGNQVPVGTIMSTLLPRARLGGLQWDDRDQSPYFDYSPPQQVRTVVSSTDAQLVPERHRVYFDDEQSLRIKYAEAAKFGLRGVGCWHIDALDYRLTHTAGKQRASIFRSLDAFRGVNNTRW